MKYLIILTALLGLNSVYAMKLDDVKVLDINYGKDNFELKLHSSEGPKDSYFYVDITKDDPKAFDKLALVIKKMRDEKKFKLDLDIPSFSPKPSGSYYRSSSVDFSEGK